MKIMIRKLAASAFLAALLAFPLSGALLPISAAAQVAGPVFELRIYTATPGNLGKLLARFRDHTMRIFEKHGMNNVGYWVPTDPAESENTLVYILKHDSQAAADASWQAFSADPEWQRVNEESNRDGRILESVERRFMRATDFSPVL